MPAAPSLVNHLRVPNLPRGGSIRKPEELDLLSSDQAFTEVQRALVSATALRP